MLHYFSTKVLCFITEYLGKETIVNIPPTIDGKKVITMGNDVFKNANKVTDVKIPNSVTRIDSNIFKYCSDLRSVDLPDDYITGSHSFAVNNASENTVYTFLGKTYRLPEDKLALYDALYPGTGKLFIRDDGELTKVSIALKETVIPDNVTTVRSKAFENCDLIESVTIPDSAKSIDNCFGENPPESLPVTYKGKTYKSNQLPVLYNAVKKS